MIQVENLVKRYGNHVAVDGLTFTVEQGKIYGFLGPNGAGKSTTMNVMTGYIAADGGTVMIGGYDILKEPVRAKSCIGYLPEVPPLYPDMTVWEFLLFAAELKKVPKKERKGQVEELLKKLELAEMRNRLIKNLSKGYRQRVGFAQALVGDPKVLILDEPMVGLDPKQIIEMRDLIRELAGEHTVLLSSHILSEVSAVCDHILIISKGKLAAGGSPEELQEMMHGTVELLVTVVGEQGQIRAVLDGMDAAVQYSLEEGSEEGSVLVRVRTEENADIRRELSVALSGAGMPILSMSRSEKSLEDIFLELTEAEEPEVGDEELAEETEADDMKNKENKSVGETEVRESQTVGREELAEGIDGLEETEHVKGIGGMRETESAKRTGDTEKTEFEEEPVSQNDGTANISEAQEEETDESDL